MCENTDNIGPWANIVRNLQPQHKTVAKKLYLQTHMQCLLFITTVNYAKIVYKIGRWVLWYKPITTVNSVKPY